MGNTESFVINPKFVKSTYIEGQQLIVNYIDGSTERHMCLDPQLQLHKLHEDIKNMNLTSISHTPIGQSFPVGTWINTARNYYITDGHILHAELQTKDGTWITDHVKILPRVALSNVNGKFWYVDSTAK